MANAKCASCGFNLPVGPRPKIGQQFVCSGCDEIMEVVWLDPVELDWPIAEDDDDWEVEQKA